jgi:hypothetical protein
VRLELEFSTIKYKKEEIYKCTKLISADEIDGKTYWKK